MILILAIDQSGEIPGPEPLSIFTTATLVGQELSLASKMPGP